MATQIMGVVLERIPLIATTLIVCLSAFLVQFAFARDRLSTLPLVGASIGNAEKRRKAYLAGANSVYLEGYQKFKDRAFRVTNTHNEAIVVPPALLPELQKLPDDILSFPKSANQLLETKYTRVDTDEPHVIHTIKARLTPSLPRLNPAIAEEVGFALRTELPPCQDWTEIEVYSKVLRIVARVSGRIFIGPELCHDEAYINSATKYTVDVFQAVQAIKGVRRWQRRLRVPWLPELKALDMHEEEATRFLRPIVTARRRAEKEPGYQKPDDVLQWMMDTPGVGNRDDRVLAKLQLSLNFAAIHTTSMTLTNAFYDLAAHPELIPELREEIQTVLAAHGNQFTSPALQKMRKLDSCLKETLRMNPAGQTTFNRKVLKTFALSNGQVIPAGAMIETAGYAVSHDAEVFAEPERYDGLRFYGLRQRSEDFNRPGAGDKAATSLDAAAHNQFVSVSQNMLTFGYGRHACPGRFFAANEVKMIMARTLLTYDIRNIGEERYPNFMPADMCIPDPTRKLLFKAR